MNKKLFWSVRKKKGKHPSVFWVSIRKILKWKSQTYGNRGWICSLRSSLRDSGDWNEYFRGENVVSSHVKWKQTPQMTNCFSTDTSALRLHARHQRSSWCTRWTGDNSDSQIYSLKRKIGMSSNQQAKECWLWRRPPPPAFLVQPVRADTIHWRLCI